VEKIGYGKHYLHTQPDVVLVGARIMSATLAVFLKELDPALDSGTVPASMVG
jgi:hypothetical protein